MKKRYFVIFYILFSIILISCDEKQNGKTPKVPEIQEYSISSVYDHIRPLRSQLQQNSNADNVFDSGINSVDLLDLSSFSKSHFSDFASFKDQEYLSFFNKQKTQIISFFGNLERISIKYIKNYHSTINAGEIHETDIPDLITNKGITLGMRKDEIKFLLGSPVYTINEKGYETFYYQISDLDPNLKSQILAEYEDKIRFVNIYTGIYIFKNNRLIEMSFGFPSP
jgi:outer membrane protein assembly factor BamE (lipoprotein component of BamABCDE complex)